MPWRLKPRRTYKRGLPAGGFVAIDVVQTRSIWRGRLYEGKLVVERRSTSRRKGHTPPVVGQAWGRTVEEVVQQLLPAAQYNPAIGAAILRLETV
jgi:hypothetical protein